MPVRRHHRILAPFGSYAHGVWLWLRIEMASRSGRLSHPPSSAWLWSSKDRWVACGLSGRHCLRSGAHGSRVQLRCMQSAHALSGVVVGDCFRCGAAQLCARAPLVIFGTVALPAHQQLAAAGCRAAPAPTPPRSSARRWSRAPLQAAGARAAGEWGRARCRRGTA